VSEPPEPLRIDVAGATHAGRVRPHNEDAWAIASRLDLWTVADGVAGRPAGRAAAETAVATLRDAFDEPERTWPTDPVVELEEGGTRLAEAASLANRRIRERGAASAATFAAVLALPGHVWVAHAGDARVYRLRDRRLERLTCDHCVGSDPRAAEWFGEERLASARPDALTRALGLRETVALDLRMEDLRPRDVVLLATDGLTRMVGDPTIAEVLAEHGSACTAVDALIARALDLGGCDNVTCIVGRWVPYP
jgi:serine/threonine protein phosphatase PrpC